MRRALALLLLMAGLGGPAKAFDFEPGCEMAFPVMEDISAWRLLQGWSIDLVDPIRRIRIRFETPDNRYVPFGDPKDIAGIDEIVKVKDKPDATKK